ncbi:MAG: NRDE family protein [Gammaproteobacteria bacterium]|nr:NRDE family protein [Gammaproteobacteria bacterium]
MCLIALSWQTHARYPLLIAANRDEFHARPTDPAAPWQDTPQVYGGRDRLQSGGWLAVSRRGRLAAVTNVRRMLPPNPRALSRGRLVADFVRADDSALEFCEALMPHAQEYGGFNLLLWDGACLRFATNQGETGESREVDPGIHVLSNATLDTPWPKSERLRTAMQQTSAHDTPDIETLFTALADTAIAPDAALPNTGLELERERWLSSPFIRGPEYGTRASTVVLVAQDRLRFVERRFGPNGRADGDSDRVLPLAVD